MQWADDKILHYRKAFNWGRKGSIIGFLIIVLILAPGKEITDAFSKDHKCEWLDYVAGVKGAWDGVLFWREPKF